MLQHVRIYSLLWISVVWLVSRVTEDRNFVLPLSFALGSVVLIAVYGHGVWRLDADDVLSSWILIVYALIVVIDYICGKLIVRIWWYNKRWDLVE